MSRKVTKLRARRARSERPRQGWRARARGEQARARQFGRIGILRPGCARAVREPQMRPVSLWTRSRELSDDFQLFADCLEGLQGVVELSFAVGAGDYGS